MSAASAPPTACVLCDAEGGIPVWRGPEFRVIRADDAIFPGFYRVIWNAHVAEFSDLSLVQRHTCMEAVSAVEQVVRRHLQPDKVNLAALGNMVPHLHWHVIARFNWDSHFPGAVWAAAQRPQHAERLAAVAGRLPQLDLAIAAALA